jgi:hypothetical protein
MLTLTALVVSLSGSFVPAQASLLGASPEVRRAAQLTGEAPQWGTGVLLAQDAPPPPPPSGLATPRTLAELQAERARLDGTRPSLGGPIALLAVGAGLCVVGLGVGLGGFYTVLVYFFTGGSLGTVSTVLTIAGFVLLGIGVAAIGVGIPLAVIGGRRLASTIRERRAVGAQLNALDEQIRAMEQGAPTIPLPPPTSVERNQGPQPYAVVANF